MKKILVSILAILLSTQNVFAEKLLLEPRNTIPVIEKLNFNPNRVVILKDQISDIMVKQLQRELRDLDKSNGEIVMIINSPGGSVVAGFELIQTMENLNNNLTCIVETRAFSMAALTAAYCTKLYVHKFATLMFHEANYQVGGSQTQVRVLTERTEKYLDQLLGDTAEKMGITLPEFKKRIHDEWWITVDEAVKIGFASAKLRKLKYNEKESILLDIFKIFELPFKIFK